jgi:hypothetical protein
VLDQYIRILRYEYHSIFIISIPAKYQCYEFFFEFDIGRVYISCKKVDI